MRKITLIFVLFILSSTLSFSQWQKVDLTKSGGGVISNVVNQLALDNGKLYAATADGVFESATADGADWTPYGLQGKRVFMMSFGVLKLALTIETAADDATKKTLQLYKHDGSDWVNTNFNPSKLNVFGTYSDNLINFTQIQNGQNTVILVPTWGNGIWRSGDGGSTWAQVAYEDHPTNGYQFFRKIPGVYTFAGDNVIYGTDKADFNMQYFIYSEDYGITWKQKEVVGNNFFNPWSLHKRSIAGKSYFYWAGKDGSHGMVWRSADSALTWDASPTTGAQYWDNRRIIGDDDGPLYVMSSANNVYVSTEEYIDSNEGLLVMNFVPVGTGITIPSPVPAPTTEPFFLTHLIKSSAKLYVSTYNDGIYQFTLAATSVKDVSSNKVLMYVNPAQNELIVTAALGSKISIYSVTGRLIKTESAESIKSKISINELDASVYIVKSVSGDGLITTNRFVKQ